MKKLVALVAVVGVAVLVAGSAHALSVGNIGGATLKGVAKDTATKAGKKAIEAQINNEMGKVHCTCKGAAVDKSCFSKAAASLKAQHEVAERSGFADFNITVTAPEACKGQVEDVVKNVFGSWDSSVNADKKAKAVDFKVSLD